MQNKSAILKDIEDRLNSVRDRENRTKLFSNAFVLGTLFFSLITILVSAEALFELSSPWRTAIAFCFIILLLSAGGWLIIRPLLQWLDVIPSVSDHELAKRVGVFFPSIKDRLLNALQLAKKSKTDGIYSAELTDESLKKFASEIGPLDFNRSVDTVRIPKSRLRFLISMGVFIIFAFVFSKSFSGASYRLLHFSVDFTPPPKFSFEISPGNKEIVKGESVAIKIRVHSLLPGLTQSPKNLTLIRRQEGQENFDEMKLGPDSGGIFHAVLPGIRLTTEYFARYADLESDHYALKVIDRPLIRSFHVRLDYPAYTKIPSKVQDDFVGDVMALAGTRLIITGASSKLLKEAKVEFGNNSKIPLSIKSEKFSGSFPVVTDNSYYISITDEEGLSNAEPVRYQIKIIQDEYPSVSIIEPGKNVDVAGSQSLPLLLQAKDDFGFTGMRLGYRLIKSRYEQAQKVYSYTAIPIPLTATGQMELSYIWNLSGLDLVPEDIVEYFVEVFDNDVLHGPKSGRSSLFLLRLPSLDEVFADMDKEHEESLEDLKQSLEDAKKLKDEIESVNQDLKKNKDPDWQMQKKMEEMAKQYEELQKKLDKAQSRLEQMTRKAQEQNVLSKETMEKYFELQQLFEQLDSAELQNALKQLQQRMPNISRDQLQQAMQKITFSDEQFRQSIERTMSLLKRIQIEQKMDEVKKRAQELEKMEKELSEEGAKANSGSPEKQELAKKQADLIKKEEAMEREAADLQRRMEEFFTEMPADKLRKALEKLQQQQLSQKMQKSAQQMQAGNMQQAQQMQQQIGEQLQQFSQQMEAMQQEMLQQQGQYVMNEMRKAINNILEISKDEEALKEASKNAPQNSPQLRENAQDQQRAMQDLSNVVKGLSELSQKSFAVTPEMAKTIGEALAHMKEAMRALDMRNGSSASREQEQSMASLNRAAMQVQNALQSLMQGGGAGSAGSLMQQLQMMAGQQMSINLQTQQMGGISPQQAAQAARIAKEQSALRKSLEELNREAGQSSEHQKLLGDLQKIAEEMQEVIKNLEQNNVNPETMKKQERILSRLLDASRSMRERDYEKKRKAEVGTQITRKSPADIDLNSLEGKDKLRQELLKALEQGYSKDYQELIRKYFEELEKNEVKK